jgi:hypothetical protein
MSNQDDTNLDIDKSIRTKTMTSGDDSIPIVSSQSSSLWTSLRNKFDNFRIDARTGRLNECRLLDDTLKDCLNVAQRKQSERLMQLEDTKTGTRIVRLMGWQKPRISKADTSLEMESEIIGQYDENKCQREAHAIWICRALCLQCGKEIVTLKDCIDVEGKANFLNHSNTAYKGNLGNKMKNSISSDKQQSLPPCSSIQQQIGKCVAHGVIDLEKRKKEQV